MYKLYKFIAFLLKPFHLLAREFIFLFVKLRYSYPEPNKIGIDSSKPTLYVLSAPGYLNSLVLEKIAIKNNLPLVKIANLTKDLAAKNIIWLKQDQDYKKHHSKFNQNLIYKYCQLVKQEKADLKEIQIQPVNIFWGRKLNKEKSFIKLLTLNYRNVLGPFRRFFAIVVHGRQLYIQWGKPVTLAEVITKETLQKKDANYIATKSERLLNLYFRRIATQVLGPDLSHKHSLIQGLLRTQKVAKAMQLEAEKTNSSMEKIRIKSEKIAKEIASNQSDGGIRFLYIILQRLWTKLYNGTNIANLENIKNLSGKYAVVYLPAHRSHIDYLLLSYILYLNGVMPPHIAAGINLNMPIIGGILRRGGAFFMRRSFKQDQLYKAIFEEYVHTLFDKGHPVEYFIEGGRSRTGRTLNPRPGLLAMTVKSAMRGTSKPLLLVPVYFGYERVLEGGSYLGELKGKKKQKESIFSIFKIIPTLKQNFGEVSVNFGEPLVLDKYLSNNAQLLKQAQADDKQAFFELVEKLGLEIVSRINRAAVINPVNLFSTVLLSSQHLALELKVLRAQIQFLIKLQKQAPYSKQIILPELDSKEIMQHIDSMKLIQTIEHPRGDLIKTDENTGIMLTWYRNNIAHIYIAPSLIAFMFNNKRQSSKDLLLKEFALLMPILEREFFIDLAGKNTEQFAEEILAVMVDSGLLIYNATKKIYKAPALDSLAAIQLRLLAQLIRPTLERGYLILHILTNPNRQMQKDDLILECVELAKRLSILQGLNSPDFFDKNLFESMLNILLENDFLFEDENGKLTYNSEIAKSANSLNTWFDTQLRHNIMQLTWDESKK